MFSLQEADEKRLSKLQAQDVSIIRIVKRGLEEVEKEIIKNEKIKS